MRRARAALALLLLLVLLVPGAAALRVAGSVNLNKLNPGDSFTINVLLDNTQDNDTVSGDYDTSVQVPQAYTQADQDAIPSWVGSESGRWTVEAGKTDNFTLTLDVPLGAHSGPYSLVGNFIEDTQVKPGGVVTSFIINHAFGLAFVVRGVDVIGRIAIPQVVKPETVLDDISLTIGNYLSQNVTGRPVQELWALGASSPSRVFDFAEKPVPLSPTYPTTSFNYGPDFRGLPKGEYLVRTYARYTVEGETQARESRAKEQTLIIGEEILTFTGYHVGTPVGRFPLPDGETLELPRKINATVQFNVANVGDLLAVADLSLRVQKRGGEAQILPQRQVAIAAGALQPVGLDFALPAEGVYDLQIREEERPIWNATIDAQKPTVELEGPGLDRDRLKLTLRNRGVIVNACYTAEIRDTFNRTIPGRNATSECLLLSTGAAWNVNSQLDIAGLPDGPYVAHVRIDWTGSDGAQEFDLPFRLPLESALDVIIGWFVRFWFVWLGLLALLLALLFALRRRKKEDEEEAKPQVEAEQERLTRLEEELKAREDAVKRREEELGPGPGDPARSPPEADEPPPKPPGGEGPGPPPAPPPDAQETPKGEASEPPARAPAADSGTRSPGDPQDADPASESAGKG